MDEAEVGSAGADRVAEGGYRAFLSYSHADDAAARKLHRRLETYRLPDRLAPPDEAGDGARRLGPIFRDREDFPAAVDLSESVKRALDISGALIVLCSPDAKASPWVAKEIVYFRAHHPDRPILAALLRGEPAEAFPAELTEGAEPLAADLRRDGDGQRIGFLKLVAGLAGVPLDALVQRDAQRRMRRVTAVTLASLVALIVMAGMTILALQSRNEAERQRAEAEGLIEYMLTDLREDLRGVGRLDVMTDVNERAMDYYEGQGDLSRLSADSLERRARILHAMGEDDEARGDLAAALEKFREAHRVTAELLDREPDNADRIFAHAQSEYWVGHVAEMQEDFDAAGLHYANYESLARRLNQIEPDTTRSIMEMGYALLNRGIVGFKTRDDNLEARHLFRVAIGYFRAALDREPRDAQFRYELANAYSWLADTYYIEEAFAESRSARQISHRLKSEIAAADPENLDAQYDLLIEERALALHAEKLGQPRRAREMLEAIDGRLAALAHADSENQWWDELRDLGERDLRRLREETQ